MTDRPLHIAQIIGHFGGGGAERVAANLAQALQRHGVSSTCVAIREAGSFSQSQPDMPTIDLEANNGLSSRWRGLKRLRQFIATERPDLLHVHGPQSLVFTALALQTTRHRPRLWFTWHDSSAARANQPLSRSIQWALRRCDRIFGSSKSVCHWLNAQLAAQRQSSSVEVFINAIPECPADNGLAAECPHLVWAARLVPDKDPQMLIRALTTLHEEGLAFRATVAGSPYPHLQWFADQTQEFIQQHGLGDLIDMPGWVDDTPALYARSAIGVQTSHTEGLSMTLLEQMMAGLAIVATDVGDTAVAIEHEKTGLLIPPKDEAALTAALRRLITDPALRQRLGAAAREKALAEFSLDAMARRVLEELGQHSTSAAANPVPA